MKDITTYLREKATMTAKKQRMSEEMWAELKGLYESGTYSQRQLVDYASKRGYGLSTATVQRRVADEGWIKGSVKDAIIQEVLEEQKSKIGKAIVGMLDLHQQQSRALMAEAMRTLAGAEKKRETVPDYVLPATTMVSITNVLEKAQSMQARSLGWNYKEGRPLGGDESDNAEDLTKFDVSCMSEDEERELKSRTVTEEDD